ncbi:nucleotide sugar dehydrogenase [Agrococcus sp. SCSIO52902]|uniref:nucleotide sugar dehydrogenase n=1 Tax=Agrococcus sp. SCSIO52902 TaxID=2933290 RepID=UPI001FF24EA8|nr:nucleotide sugar dehydrogenase [Agrococcus sp. SCSIO52902]UOV99864.1 nucleotide sugar dehydrogenase [Agrococcus sp. SCSIO52902]
MAREVTIIGQGYVGLPLAQAASEAGWTVHGLDVSERMTADLNAGRSHIDDLSDQDVSDMLERGYRATTDASVISSSEVVIICVPTPLGDGGGPDLTAVRSAVTSVGQNMRPGVLVVLESTTYPGTTDGVVAPMLESLSGLTAGADFDLAFSPERVNPGDPVYGIKNTPKLVGGATPKAGERASSFYASFVDDVVVLSGAKEAETAKLLENTFRHVNIALVNEMAKFCHEMGIDIWEVIRGAGTKPFGFMKFTPGPGVGGHCIPIDPNYLAFHVKNQLGYPFRFVELAQEINNSMPDYVVSRVARLLNEQQRAVNGSRILLLGVTYKPDIADQRESPSTAVAEKLQELGADISFHDPFVDRWRLATGTLARVELEPSVRDADIVVLLQAHTAYDLTTLQSLAATFFDTRGKTAGLRL